MNQLRKEMDDSRQKGDVVIALCGNKCDQYDKRQVRTEDAREYATKEGLLFIETSAKTSENVQNTFLTIAKTLLSKKPEKKPVITGTVKTKGPEEVQPGGGCCG